jgi:ABC-type branched-subunit amino acid transport system substrate-binding protein
METELRSNLMTCFEAFLAATNRSRATVAQAAAGDWRFFDRLSSTTFTARKYDAVMLWFAENWPEGAARPPCLLSRESAA